MLAQNGTFENISQRAVYSYIRLLAGEPETDCDELRELHVFFKALYDALYTDPAQFGLPVTPDDWVNEVDKNRTEKMAELNRKLKKPRALIASGLTFLMQVAQKARLAADPAGGLMLLLDGATFQELQKSTKVKKAFLSGLAGVGVEFSDRGACMAVRSPRSGSMLQGLKTLALACESFESGPALFNFARCDLRALDKACQPTALDLYRGLRPEQYQRAAQLHEYFTARGYTPIIGARDVHGWLVQYQGNRKIKGSPLFQMEYSERFREPLRIQIKCASTNRIAPLIARQPRTLQEDFFQRIFPCRASECDWCKNKNYLGPSVVELDGVQTTACWYSNPEVRVLDDDTVSLIKQYAEMHEGLGKE